MGKLLLLLLFIFPCASRSQTRHLTTANGLPDNVAYQTLQDQQGFLWIATDQGVVRYDGQLMKVYAREQGVPDIEVMQLVMETCGRIWLRCYDNSVAFYDPVRNRFVSVSAYIALAGLGHVKRLRALEEGGLQIDLEQGSVVMHEKTGHLLPSLHKYIHATHLLTLPDATCFTLRQPQEGKDSLYSIYCSQPGHSLHKTVLPFATSGWMPAMDENKLYFFRLHASSFYIVSGFNTSGHHIQVEEHPLQSPYYMHNFSRHALHIISRLHDTQQDKDIMDVMTYDKQHYQLTDHHNDHYLAFHQYEDQEGNQWVSTIDQGLWVYPSRPAIEAVFPEPLAHTSFYSVYHTPDGTFWAGNDQGAIVAYDHGTCRVHEVLRYGKTEWQRNILQSRHHLYTFSDGGIFEDFTLEIPNSETHAHQESKVVLALNDSLILSGATNGLCLLNTKTSTLTGFYNGVRNVTALALLGDNLYIGSTSGLYRYSLSLHRLQAFQEKDERLNERVVALRTTADGWLWVATATNGLLAVWDNHIRSHLREQDGLNSNNCSALCTGKPGQLWLANSTGLCRIRYRSASQGISFQVQNVSGIDGLSSTVINQLDYQAPYLYAATERGVDRIPDSLPVPEIPMVLSAVRINQHESPLRSVYHLHANEKNVSLEFAGISLRGYYKQAEYSTDEGKTWILLNSPVLSNEFDYGAHTLWVRAVDINKHRSAGLIRLYMDIATPYWKTWWFWTLITLFGQVLIGWLWYRRQRLREREKQQQEVARAHLASLEQQAFVSLMNPHFMFNALNSIQHYINHQDRQNANRFLSDFASLIRKNFEAAQQAFIPLEQEMENIVLYLRLEKMRFHDKFEFELVYGDELDPDDWMMPTMILQPLVENAILHGLMPSKIPGRLILQLTLQHDDMLIEVIDNGIGVENSRAMKQGSKHRSRGMELIHKRLHALSFFCSRELQLEYLVPYTDTANPGNLTRLVLPASLYQLWKNAQKSMQVVDNKPLRDEPSK